MLLHAVLLVISCPSRDNMQTEADHHFECWSALHTVQLLKCVLSSVACVCVLGETYTKSGSMLARLAAQKDKMHNMLNNITFKIKLCCV